MSQLQSINIQKPSTSGDNGTPTNSCVHDLKRVLRLIEDERHLIANDLYQDIIGRIDTFRSTSLAAAAIPVKRLRLRKSKSITIKEEITKDIQEAEGMISSNRTILDNLSVSGLSHWMVSHLCPSGSRSHIVVLFFFLYSGDVAYLPKHEIICWMMITGHWHRHYSGLRPFIVLKKMVVLVSNWKGSWRASLYSIKSPSFVRSIYITSGRHVFLPVRR